MFHFIILCLPSFLEKANHARKLRISEICKFLFGKKYKQFVYISLQLAEVFIFTRQNNIGSWIFDLKVRNFSMTQRKEFLIKL